MKLGIVVLPHAWLYGENRSERTDELFMGWAVGIIEEEMRWLKVVTHYGYMGYLKTSAVKFVGVEELQRRDENGLTVFICRAFTDVMKTPKVHGRVLCTLSRGSFATILRECRNGYRNVLLADGRMGYIPCIAYENRRDNDGYLYTKNPEGYFLRQRQKKEISADAMRERIASCALEYLGVQYRWGGKSPGGLDCSGLTFMSYQMSGVLIYRDAEIVEGYPVRKIPVCQVKKGDLLYFPGHIAMYLGNWKYIHATGNEHSFGCVINSLFEEDCDYRKDLAESLYAAGSIFS